MKKRSLIEALSGSKIKLEALELNEQDHSEFLSATIDAFIKVGIPNWGTFSQFCLPEGKDVALIAVCDIVDDGKFVVTRKIGRAAFRTPQKRKYHQPA